MGRFRLRPATWVDEEVVTAHRDDLRVAREISMTERVLITGGAGFIGSHLARRLLHEGHGVRVLDNLTEQVHGEQGRPSYLEDDVELITGDIRDVETVSRALADVNVVVHLAARVGVGQSMYELSEYASVNTYGTSVLLQAMMDRPVRKLLVASSMSVYGEGLYENSAGAVQSVAERGRGQLQDGRWELEDSDGRPLAPVPTPEWKQPSLASNYALGKFDQEQMCLLFGAAYEVPTVALRFFNVYGRHQALSNPYTGVLAIFANRLLNGRPPLIFEDGQQRRDFVSVLDVSRACVLAIDHDGADGRSINIGSGTSITVSEIARRLAAILGRSEHAAVLTGKYRVGDIRHCFADISLATGLLGYVPEVDLGDGMIELAQWLEGQASEDNVESATAELASRGLTI
jgi:dTDP-L-rhamnose 4-epimerase